VLLDTSARPETADGAALREKTIAAIERDFDKVTAGVAQFATDEARHADAPWMAALRALLREIGPEAAIRQNRAIVGRGDHRQSLATWRIPVRVVCGKSDRVTPPELSRELADLIPSARLEWIEGAGHMTPLEAPAQVAAAIVALLDTQTGD
jgi:pimeloyl-ACP methyl ester carboxylesterase